jgi:lectin-like protein
MTVTRFVVALYLTAMLLPAVTRAQVLHGPVTNPTNGHLYYLLTAGSWQESETRARLFGGNLATVNDQAENDWLFTTFGAFGGQERSLWIGLSDVASENNFVWADGDPSLYRNWIALQPDDALGGEDYVHIVRTNNGFGHPGGFWNDLASPNSPFTEFDPIHGVVEVVPEPATFSLLVPIAALMCRFNRRARASPGTDSPPRIHRREYPA